MTPTFKFKTKLWLWSGGSWHFATVPKEVTSQVNHLFADLKRGWGSLKVKVTVGETTWQTSIFPDTKKGVFILPVKAEVRNKEKIQDGDELQIILELIT